MYQNECVIRHFGHTLFEETNLNEFLFATLFPLILFSKKEPVPLYQIENQYSLAMKLQRKKETKFSKKNYFT